MVHVNPNLVISMGKCLKTSSNTNHSAVFFHFCCNDNLFYKNSTPLHHEKYSRLVHWYEQFVVIMACTPQQIKHTPQNWQAPNLTSMDRDSYYVKSELANCGAHKSKST
jgi:hypothetical protein